MINIVICGVNGGTGSILKKEIENSKNAHYAGFVSPRMGYVGDDISVKPDVVIDFSNTANLDFLLEYSIKNKCALLICTTNYTDEQKAKIAEAGKQIPVMLSSNTSVGINILRKIIKDISGDVGNFDVQIIEKHHSQKIDAPSGTAKTICEDIKKYMNKDDVPVLSVRVGTIPGEHTVIYAGCDEVLEIKHTVFSKKVFAQGALEIAEKLCKKPIGMYNTEDLF